MQLIKYKILGIIPILALLLCLPLKVTAADAPFLRSFSGPIGSTITAYGLTPGNTYTVNWDEYINIIASGIVPDSGEIKFQVPKSPGGQHFIYIYSPLASTPAEVTAIFTLLPSLSLDPPSGKVGTNITVNGKGFGMYEQDISMTFAGSQVVSSISADSYGYWSAKFTVPASSSGDHAVDAMGPITIAGVSNTNFSVKPALTVLPPSGPVNSRVTVFGTGFAASEREIAVTYDGKTVASGINANNAGSWAVIFNIPVSTNGNHDILASGTSTFTNTLTPLNYNVTSGGSSPVPANPPGVPEIKSPLNKQQVGLVGKTAVKFEWSQVSGSGITYDLQVSADSGFAKPLIDHSKISTASYESTGSEALTSGEYYWRIRAVDASGNASKWSGPVLFQVGINTLMLVISVVIAVAIIGLVVFLALRFFRKKI